MSYLRFFGLPIVAVMVGNALAALPPESELPRAPVPRAPVPRAPVQQRINLPPESELPSALAPSAAPPVTVSDRVKADGSSERKLPAESALPPLAGDPAPAPAGPLPLAGSPDGIPWLRLNLRGHTAPVRAAKFLSSGNRFCTAGDDKSVVVWLRDAAGAGRWHYERTIRWQIQRGTRGRIYALAAAPGILALAGEGAMGGTGEIVLVDPASGDYVSTLFDQANGHRQVVIALNFVETPDGPALASQSMDGRTLLWSKNKRGVWRAAVVMVDDRVAGTPVELSRQLLADRAFSAVVALDRQRVVVPVYDHRQQQRPVWRLEIFDLAAASQTPLGGPTGAPHRHGVTAMATDANRTRLISADGTGQIHVWDLKANPVSSVRLKRPQSAQALALSLSADGQTLALGTVASSLQQGATVEVWDLSNLRRPQLKTTRSSKGHVRACAVSADSIVSSDGNSVVVHNLADPWSKQVLRGATDTPLRVAFARDKPFYRIGIGTQTDDRGSVAIDRLFDTDRLQLTRTAAQNEQRWLPVDWGRGRWRVVESIDNRGRRQWMFEEGGARRARLPLVEERTGAFRSVCWIPGDDLERPPLAALGTSAGGIVVVQVTARGDAPIVRRFRGHGSEVTSMAVSRDLRWLVSGSTDTTVRVWPLGLLPLDPLPRDPLLRDLLPLDLLLRDPLLLDPLPLDPLLRGRVNQESGGLNRWGATFQTDDAGRFVVASIREDGPLYFRGARIGDEVVSIQKIENGQRRTVEAPEQLLSELAAAAWDRMVEFELRTGRQASHRFQILPAWQQLASLVTSGNGEWAFWAPSGYYDASFQGHQLFGWQINRGLEGLPDFFLAAQFRAILERPEVMSRLMRARTLEAAFRAAHATTPAHSAETIANMYRLKPEVTILPPFATELGRGRAGHRLQAQIRVPAGQTLVQPKAFANGVVAAPGQLLKSETDGGDELLLYQWQLAIPSDPRVLVQVIAATENEITASDQRVLENSVSQPDRMPRLFLLAVGIDRYRDAQIPKLRTPVAHVRRLTDLVRSHCSALYRVEATALLDQRATRPAWTLLTKQSAARLREQASPDDLLVIYLSGHGVQDAAGDQYHFVTADAEYAEIMAGGFADCLSFADFSQFSDISCRKLVILDTCHGGAIQPMRHREMKAAIRALQQDLFITLAASQGAEEAVEGRFSRRLIEALTGAADRDGGNRDGVVRLDELIAYVQRMVTVDSLHDSFHQTPSAGPSDLLPFVTPPMSIVAPQDQVGQIDRRRR